MSFIQDIWSHISGECILYPTVLLKKSRDLSSDPCVGPVIQTSYTTSLPLYFWFQGQAINAGISSACPSPGHSTHPNTFENIGKAIFLFPSLLPLYRAQTHNWDIKTLRIISTTIMFVLHLRSEQIQPKTTRLFLPNMLHSELQVSDAAEESARLQLKLFYLWGCVMHWLLLSQRYLNITRN